MKTLHNDFPLLIIIDQYVSSVIFNIQVYVSWYYYYRIITLCKRDVVNLEANLTPNYVCIYQYTQIVSTREVGNLIF